MNAIKIQAKTRLTASWKDEILNSKIVAAVSELEKLVKIKNVQTDGYNDAEEEMAGCEVHFEGKDQSPVSTDRGWLSAGSLKKLSDWCAKAENLPDATVAMGVGEDGEFCVVILSGM